MGRTLTNNLGFAVAEEASLGVLPAQPVWETVEVNTINQLGTEITTTARSPISPSRQRRKGTPTDLTSGVEYETDFTMQVVNRFTESFLFSTWEGPPTAYAGANRNEFAIPTTSTMTFKTPVNLGASTVFKNRSLVYVRGTSSNNGLRMLTSAGSQSGPVSSLYTVTLTSTTPALVVETPTEASGASVEYAGYRGASGDITWSIASGVYSLQCTSTDFTTLPLKVGQFIVVGGPATENQFSNGRVTARVRAITATILQLDKVKNYGTTSTLASTATNNGSGKEIDLLFGRFCRNVPVSDSRFKERSYTFEAAWSDLGANGTDDEYEYSRGNYCNQIAISVPLTEKCSVTPSFVGQDTAVPTLTRATNAASPIRVTSAVALNSVSDVARLSIQYSDTIGITTDFKNMTLTLNNNVTPEKVIGFFGGKFINLGNLEVDLEASVVFTSKAVVQAIRDNATVSMDFALRNSDGGVIYDIPSMTLGNGARELPVNESVTVSLSGQADGDDATFPYSLGVSTFPYFPA